MPTSSSRRTLSDALEIATAALPAAETRPGQRQMATAVEEAIAEGRHLVVQAGTGTGKTIAYLVPAMLAGKRTVVATATKALQDQLAKKDLPFLVETLSDYLGHEVSWAVLKGRRNYVCRQRIAEVTGQVVGKSKRDDSPTLLDLDDFSATNRREIDRIVTWAATTPTGDFADLDFNPSERATLAVSVGSEECPGANRCPFGGSCFAEMARARAAEAEIIVVNTHLYGNHIASDGALLPEHDIVIVDEAHGLEDIMSDTVGISIGEGSFTYFAGAVRRILDDPKLNQEITDVGLMLDEVLAPHLGNRLNAPLPANVAEVLATGRRVVGNTLDGLRRIETKDDDSNQRKLRAQMLATRLADTLDAALTIDSTFVPFVTGRADRPKLDIAPLDVAPILREGVWTKHPAILTSATIPSNMPARIGLPVDDTVMLDVESPFDYPENSILYCSTSLPEPNSLQFTPRMHDELFHLITAAGGRTLALFTSYKAMDAAVTEMRKRLTVTIFAQNEYQRGQLVRMFTDDETSCLFATASFFQGIDIPGRTLSLVTLDRIPFPRPDDPLLSARREALGDRAFRDIDLPRAATLLAQATGRLIRNASDRGVVAVFDPRLGTKGYRREILATMPPMRRSTTRSEVEEFLRHITR
ncbi:MAG: ATP-dependent DNA helicase [Ilumatobacteraceae bacterium]|nr:ATP-dependent DNA helicase [Ilumatobacteraceae bacterium]